MRTRFPLLAGAMLLCAQLGCAPRTKAHATAMTIGGVMLAGAGGLVLADLDGPGNDTTGSGRDDTCAEGGCAVGALLLATGAILAIVGYTGYDAPEEATSEPALMPAEPARTPAPDEGVDIRVVLSLPEVPVDAETLQLAKRARSATRRDDCRTARYIVGQIEDRDPRYAAALLESPALARCAHR